jgi:hypothetical protein
MSIARLLWLYGTAGSAMAWKKDESLPTHGAGFTISRMPISGPRLPMSGLQVTDHVVKLKRGDSKGLSAGFVQGLRKGKRAVWGGEATRAAVCSSEFFELTSLLIVHLLRQVNQSQLISVEAGQVFLAPVTVGGQRFEVVIDTGSSDPWLVTPDFVCANPYTGENVTQEECYFGAAYDSRRSSTFAPIPNQNFNISYTDQEALTGDFGNESFTLGGITMSQQKFALVEYAAWLGDGYSSGLIGFAYSSLTSAYAGDDPRVDMRGNTIPYNPLFVNMYNQSLVPPIFSLAINRDPSDGGLLALGGIPDVPHAPYWVSVPIENLGFVYTGTDTPAYSFYRVAADGFAFSSSPATQFNVLGTNNPFKTPIVHPDDVIIDSGTSLIYAPNAVARLVGLAFTPPAIYDQIRDAWFVDCNAQPPVFGVSIGQKIFYVNGLDMIVPTAEDECISGVQPNNDGLTILGDVWMKNVISVFDIGAAMMRFAAREFYGLTGTPVAVTT